MAITSTVILDRVETTLIDAANVQWTRAELLDYLNQGIRFIILHRPDSYIVNEAIQLTANETKQTIPSPGYQLMDVHRNMGAAGTTIGRAITKTLRSHLDNFDPDWHTVTGSVIKNFVHDKRDGSVFWVYPRPTSAIYIQVSYCSVPSAISEPTAIPIDDIYETPLFYFILAMAYMKNSKRGDITKMVQYLTMLNNSLNINVSVTEFMSPMTPDSDSNINQET